MHINASGGVVKCSVDTFGEIRDKSQVANRKRNNMRLPVQIMYISKRIAKRNPNRYRYYKYSLLFFIPRFHFGKCIGIGHLLNHTEVLSSSSS